MVSAVDYYLARSAHGSTLSRVVHASVLAAVDRSTAWSEFREALDADLDDTQGGTTGHGIHLGAMAGTVDIVLRTFTGMRMEAETLVIRPRPPGALRRVTFELRYRDQRITVTIDQHRLQLSAHPGAAPPVHVMVDDITGLLAGGESLEFPIRAQRERRSLPSPTVTEASAPHCGGGPQTRDAPRRLTRFAWLAIAAAITTMALKTGAWALTGSVGFLSDAAESIVNLVTALVALRVAARPSDESHNFGHGKAEYLSAAVEGVMIFVASIAIIIAAVERLIHPIALEQVGLGLLVSAVAGGVNGMVGVVLLRVGRQHRSLTLTADGKHLLTDLWTSVGVIVGVIAVALTGFERLDPVVALVVGVNIVVTGSRLLVRSLAGLMDHALPAVAQAEVTKVLNSLATDRDVTFHAVRTRGSGRHQLVSLHVVVPGDWSVRQGHDVLVEVEAAVGAVLASSSVQTHLEPQGESCPDDADEFSPSAHQRPEGEL
ncbi:MAG: cation diffusion facilitator family transporter [Mycobacteriaceae bacterium]